MQITKSRCKLVRNCHSLRAFVSLTLDDTLTITGLRVIENARGLSVHLPCRRYTDHCAYCNGCNHLKASYCNYCGKELDPTRGTLDEKGRRELYEDFIWPLNAEARTWLETAALGAYRRELVEQEKLWMDRFAEAKGA